MWRLAHVGHRRDPSPTDAHQRAARRPSNSCGCGVPAVAILTSSIVGFLCVVAAAVSPDTVFSFQLNSSGAVILFVYCLIGISQIVVRYRNGSENLRVKMWMFPVLSIFTVGAIMAILAQMGIQKDSRSQLVLSLLSWAVVIVLYLGNKWFIARRPEVEGTAVTAKPRRVLVLANETADSNELLTELHDIGADVPRATSSSSRAARSRPAPPARTGPSTWPRRPGRPRRPGSSRCTRRS